MKHRGQTWISALSKILAFLFLTLLFGGCTPLSNPLGTKILPSQMARKQEGVAIGLLPQGTKVDDLDVSGCSIPEAETKMNEWAQDKLEETRVLLYNETEIPFTIKDLGLILDNQKIIEEIGRKPGQALSSVLKVDKYKLNSELQEKLVKYGLPANDASYKIENDMVVIKPAESGRTVNIDRMISDIQKVPLSEVPKRIEIPMVKVSPAVTTEAIETLAFDTIIGEYTTMFAVEEKNRSANLAAAAKALDRKVISPGEIFSFNDTVGPREPETGYKSAYVIVNGEYVKGTGGGICQVSSTLYNVVLLGNLGVVERMPHAVAVSYVPTGQDATVNYPNIDFKFKNDTASLLYLRTEVKPGSLTLRIWGKKTDKSVRIERQVEKEMKYKTKKRLDPNLPAGRVIQEQKGSNGSVVNTWKVIRDGDGSETKLFLSCDTYAPTNRILRVGI